MTERLDEQTMALQVALDFENGIVVNEVVGISVIRN
jgi:hypothetical protein